MVQRYVKLKRKKMLEADPTTEWCPRQWCQGPARWDKPKNNKPSDSGSEDEEPGPQTMDSKAVEQEQREKHIPIGERLAICEDCSFAFCRVCKKGWHGVTGRSCYPRPKAELTAEEKASEEYLLAHSTQCPTCSARCQKTMGCNHMICFKCQTHFCYLCSAWLMPENPYIHFNSRDQSCYMRLWELEGGDGIQDPPRRHPPLFENPNHNGPADIHARPRVRAVPPPPAPIPPRPEPVQGVRVNAQVQQGLVRPQPLVPAPARGPPVPGLQRFLQLAQNDEEEGWDSDELEDSDDEEEEEDDDDDDRWEIRAR